MNDSMFWLFITIIFTGFFSGSETAFVSVNKIKLKYLANKGSKKADKVIRFLEDPDNFLAVTLVGTNICHVLASAIGALFISRLVERFNSYLFTSIESVLTTIIITPSILILGDILPKALYREYATRISMIVYYPIIFFNFLFYPIIKFITYTSKKILYILGVKHLPKKGYFTRQDLEIAVKEANINDQYFDGNDMITEVFSLNDLIAKDVMTPRTEIVAIEKEKSVRNVLELMAESSFSRIPVYEDSIDNIIGIVYIFDLFEADENEPLVKYIREVPFIPEIVKCDKLLRNFNKWHSQMAIVIDEFGGTAGVVTIEDVLEELFGEIEDEYDETENQIIALKNANNVFRIYGDTEIEKVEEYLGIKIPEGDYETIAGFVISLHGGIPAPGEKIENTDHLGMEIKVESASSKKVKVILLKLLHKVDSKNSDLQE